MCKKTYRAKQGISEKLIDLVQMNLLFQKNIKKNNLPYPKVSFAEKKKSYSPLTLFVSNYLRFEKGKGDLRGLHLISFHLPYAVVVIISLGISFMIHDLKLLL